MQRRYEHGAFGGGLEHVPGKPVTVSMKNGRTTTDCIVVPEDGDL